MSIEAQIKQKIIEEFSPERFELINESDKHVGHAGHDGSGDSHFKLMVVSSAFDGCTRIQMHRMVTNLLNPLFDKGLHALSLDVKAASVD